MEKNISPPFSVSSKNLSQECLEKLETDVGELKNNPNSDISTEVTAEKNTSEGKDKTFRELKDLDYIPHINRSLVKSYKNNRKTRFKLLTKIRNLYYITRMSVSEIAEALAITEVTVRTYLKQLSSECQKAAVVDIDLVKDIHQFYWELQARYDERIKQLWKEFYKTSDGRLRISVLKEIREQERQHINILQELGVIHKEATKVDVKVPSTLVECSDDDLKEEIARALTIEPSEIIETIKTETEETEVTEETEGTEKNGETDGKKEEATPVGDCEKQSTYQETTTGSVAISEEK